MRRAGPAIVALLAVAAFAGLLGGCEPSSSGAALRGFQALASGTDQTYRFTFKATTTSGTATIEGTVAGTDSTYVQTTLEGGMAVQPAREFVHVGGQSFERDVNGTWEVRDRTGRGPGSEPTFILWMFATAPLVATGPVSFEGRSLHQLGVSAPMPIRDNGQELFTITRAEVLVDTAGIPVRIVAEIDFGQDDDGPGLLEARFFDVGAPLTVQAPDVR